MTQADNKSGIFSVRKSTMNEEIAWQRWRSKMHDDALRSRNLYGNEIQNAMPFNGSVRRRGVDNSYAELQPADSNTMYYAWNRSVVRYNNINNNVSSIQQTLHLNKDLHRNESENISRIKLDSCNTFRDYCHHCTIHGLKYIGDKSLPNFERVFWIFSFLMAIFGTAYFIWHLYAKYLLAPIIISRSSESVSIDQFPFPALTVCNMNNAKRSVAQEIIKGNNSLQKFFLEDICNFKSNLTYVQRDVSKESGEWENIYQFLLNVSQDCSQMLHHCEWHGNTTNCSEVFNPILTDEGLCCKFNSVPRLLYDPRSWEKLRISYASEKHIDWTPEYKFTKNDPPTAIPWRPYGSGASYGLTLALDVDADEYYCSSTASVGFKMLLHSPVESPQINDFGFTLSPGKETRVIITPHISEADKSIMKIPPKKRRCYFLNEKKLRYYRTYTQRNCLLECEANFTLKYCKCMQYYMPVANDTRICGKNDDDCAINARKFMKNKLNEEDEVKAFNFTEAPSCKCYPGCNEINYSTEISQSMLLGTFEIPDEYFKHNKSYFEKNIAVVHIFFIDDSYMKYTKKELYGFAELLSNTGGLLGLFMGFSLLSVVEILYYFTIRLWWRMLKTKKIKTNKNRTVIQPFMNKRDTIYPFVQ